MPSSSILEEAGALALSALDEARSSMMLSFRFMDMALWRLPQRTRSLARSTASDGYELIIDPVNAVSRYKNGPDELIRDYLHTVLHCVFHHPFDGAHPRLQLWDLACDIAVEACALDLCGKRYPSKLDADRTRELDWLSKTCSALTAAKLYHALIDIVDNPKPGQPSPEERIDALATLFARDDHSVWTRSAETEAKHKRVDDQTRFIPSYETIKVRGEDFEASDEVDETSNPEIAQEGQKAQSKGQAASEGDIDSGDSFVDLASKTESEAEFLDREELPPEDLKGITWQDISDQMQMDMEDFIGRIGSEAGTFMINLTVANRKTYDYRDFLKRFAALSEEMKVSPDEFDYIYYTYGLNKYKNMPLIEPLEYSESDRVRDFVIAIDTSASCAGRFVRTFIEKTYDILKNEASFGRTMNVHVIQCDARIRKDTKITNIRDLNQDFTEFHARGFGGTDFRPVFEYVDDLIEAREFTNLKGLIYLTDGLGKFPKNPPGYETAFVFVDESQKDRKVPPWAMKVVMDEDQILEL